MMRIRWTNPQHGRVLKRSPKKPASYTKKKKPSMPLRLPDLENELAYSLDSLATISVMFDSLQHAYASSKPALDISSSPTRLCDMERELLTAYDDLGLQVVHLERHINKLEKQIRQLTATTPETPALMLDDDDRSPPSALAFEATPPAVYNPWPCDPFPPAALVQAMPCACADCSCPALAYPPLL